MQQHQHAPVLAPYGSLAFLSVMAKVGNVKVITQSLANSRSTGAIDHRKVVRRNASV